MSTIKGYLVGRIRAPPTREPVARSDVGAILKNARAWSTTSKTAMAASKSLDHHVLAVRGGGQILFIVRHTESRTLHS